MLNKTRMNNDW